MHEVYEVVIGHGRLLAEMLQGIAVDCDRCSVIRLIRNNTKAEVTRKQHNT